MFIQPVKQNMTTKQICWRFLYLGWKCLKSKKYFRWRWVLFMMMKNLPFLENQHHSFYTACDGQWTCSEGRVCSEHSEIWPYHRRPIWNLHNPSWCKYEFVMKSVLILLSLHSPKQLRRILFNLDCQFVNVWCHSLD